MSSVARFQRQASSYRFPYHWVPEIEPRFRPARVMSWALEYFAVIDASIDYLVAAEPSSVIDVGCGDGRVSATARERTGADVLGVDLVEQAIAFAKVFNHGRDGLSFVCTDLVEISELFDAAMLVEVMEHVPEAEIPRLVENVARRLRDGGSLVVSVPTTRRDVDAKHERHYDLELLRRHLRPWFEIDSHRYVHCEGVLSRWIERATANRLFALREARALQGLKAAYARWVADADERDGAHLVAWCHRAP